MESGGNAYGFGFVPTAFGQQANQGFFEPSVQPSAFGAQPTPFNASGDEDYENEPPLLEELGASSVPLPLLRRPRIAELVETTVLPWMLPRPLLPSAPAHCDVRCRNKF